jgi:hypothetical protein
MNVGILSMQRIKNYGSFLQAYALKSIVLQCGHSCSFIDILPGEQIPGLKRSFLFYLKKLFDRFFSLDFIIRIYYEFHYRNKFRIFQNELILDRSNENLYFDLVIIGSDEVFNCTQVVPWGFSLQLFGNIENTKKIITYAASFGHTSYEDLLRFNLNSKISDALKKVSSISVRDINSKEILIKNGFENISINVDPVLIYDFDHLIPHFDINEEYIIIYSYPNRMNNKEEINEIKKFAKYNNLKIYSIGFYFSWCDKILIPNPFEVLAYFKKAKYIITDTFHGTVLSIKYNKNFCTLVRESNKQKLTFLLQQFSLEGRIVSEPLFISTILSNIINFESVNNKLIIEKNKSLNYLKYNLC